MAVARSNSPGRAAPRGVNVVDLGYKCLEMFPDSHRRRGDLQTVAATWLLQPVHSHCNEAGACLICRAGAATGRPGTPRANWDSAATHRSAPLRAARPGPTPPGPTAPPGAELRARAARRRVPIEPLLLGAEPIKIRTFLLKGITITIEPLATNRWLLFHTNACLCLYVLHLFVANTCHSINRFGHLM